MTIEQNKTWFFQPMKRINTGRWHLIVRSDKNDFHDCTQEGFETDDEAFNDLASQDEASRVVGVNMSELKLAGRNTIIYRVGYLNESNPAKFSLDAVRNLRKQWGTDVKSNPRVPQPFSKD